MSANNSAYDLFVSIGSAIENSAQGQLFGKPCFKYDGKAFLCFFQDEMVFKLTDRAHAGALELEGAQLFDPSGKKRPMKEWVQVPVVHRELWSALAGQAFDYAKK